MRPPSLCRPRSPDQRGLRLRPSWRRMARNSAPAQKPRPEGIETPGYLLNGRSGDMPAQKPRPEGIETNISLGHIYKLYRPAQKPRPEGIETLLDRRPWPTVQVRRPRSPDQRGLRSEFARGRVHIHLGNGNAPIRGDCIPDHPKGAIGGLPYWRHTVIGYMAPRCRRLPVPDRPPAACVPVVKRAG